MPNGSRLIYLLPLITVAVGWLAFILIFVLRKRGGGDTSRKRDPRSIVGIVLQMGAFAAVWSFGRRPFTPLVAMNLALWCIAAAAVIVLVPGSLWMMWSSARTLGKQWSLQARVLEGHALITEGPYRFV